MPRVVAAVAVSGCVIMTATVEHRRTTAWERRLRADTVASYEKSLPPAVPEAVPRRVLVQVWAIADDVLALDHARDGRSEPGVFVRVSAGGDPREACVAWERNSGSWQRAAGDRQPVAGDGSYGGRLKRVRMACWTVVLSARASTVMTYSLRRNSSSTGSVLSW